MHHLLHTLPRCMLQRTKHVHQTINAFQCPLSLPCHSLKYSTPFQKAHFCTSEQNRHVDQLEFQNLFKKQVRFFISQGDMGQVQTCLNAAIVASRRHYKNVQLAQDIQITGIHLCVQKKKFSMALSIGNEMVSSGDIMTSKAHGAFLMAMNLNGKHQQVVELYETIEREQPELCDASMSAHYLQCLNSLGEFEKTLRVLKNVEHKGRHVYRAAMHACAELADVKTAKSVVEAILENGWSLEYNDWNMAIRAAIRAKDFAQAGEWHIRLRDSFCMDDRHGDVYFRLIQEHVRKQEWEKVIMMFEEWRDDGIVLPHLRSTPHYLQALLGMDLWKKAVVGLSQSNNVGYSDIPGELTQQMYDKVLENEDADGLALVLKSYVWTAREFTNEEVLDQLTLLSKGDHQETIHWLIQIGTRGYSDQMLSLILSNDTIPMSMKNSVQEHKIAYSNVSRFQNAVDMHQVDTIVDLVNEHQELDDLFQTDNKDFFPVVIDALFDRAIGNCEVECILIQVLDHHLATYKDSSLFTTVWDRAVTLLVEEHEDLNSEKDLPIALVFALLHSAKVHGIEIEYTRISFLMGTFFCNF